jgi:hypothetical protein
MSTIQNKDREDYFIVRDRQMFSQSYIVCALPYTSLQRLRGMGTLSSCRLTDELDECSWDEGTVTLENWLQLACIRADRLLYK